MAIHVTDADFADVVKNSDQLAVVDFWAEWCGPCKMIGPIIDELATEYEGKAKIVKVDVDNSPNTAAEYGIRNIPTILFIKNGEVVDKQVGATSKNDLMDKINKLL